jgi:hypothetical protein
MHHERDPEAINAETKPEIGYEYRDISVKGLVVSTLWFFIGTTIVAAITYVGLVMMVDLPLRSETPPATIPKYPNPLIQGSMATKVDIARVRREEQHLMNSYGWVDEKKGIARIPIEEAMKKVAEQGVVK